MPGKEKGGEAADSVAHQIQDIVQAQLADIDNDLVDKRGIRKALKKLARLATEAIEQEQGMGSLFSIKESLESSLQSIPQLQKQYYSTITKCLDKIESTKL